jgi:allophanate hydrolase subunit 2
MRPLFRVLKSASEATVQDLGRRQCMQDGVAPGGVMDLHAHAWANRLLGQSIGNPSIEVTLGMFKVEALVECVIALTGANLNASLNGRAVDPWRTYHLKPSDVLEFTSPKQGLRAYIGLGVARGVHSADETSESSLSSNLDLNLHLDLNLDATPSYKSLSTVTREHRLGLISGCILRKGDVLSAQNLLVPQKFVQAVVPDEFVPSYRADLDLELLPCYQYSDIDQAYKDQFFASKFAIQPSSNRMAYLFQQPEENEAQHGLSILPSEANAFGAVQIPPDGNPVVLLNDRQTVGGYPRIGTISRLSASQLCQRMTPAKVRFKPVSFEHVHNTMLEFESFFSA